MGIRGFFDSGSGLKGEKGDKGDKGDQGIQGIQGEKGDSGVTRQLFCIEFGENGDLANNTAEWSIGNGNDIPTTMGVTLPFDCKLVALSLSLEGAVSCEVEVWKNNSATGKKVNTVNDRHGYSTFDGLDRLEFLAGNYVALKTVVGHSSSNGGAVLLFFERDI